MAGEWNDGKIMNILIKLGVADCGGFSVLIKKLIHGKLTLW
jgi:hypothetical protein